MFITNMIKLYSHLQVNHLLKDWVELVTNYSEYQVYLQDIFILFMMDWR